MNDDILKKWIIKAENDLKLAKDGMEAKEPVTDGICFLCQQSVEKFLKAFLFSRQQPILKIHDITRLLEACVSIDKDFEYLFTINADILTEYGVEIRYPDDFYIPTLEEAQEAIAIAERVKEFVLEKIKG